ncbi:hypothetical protein K440DRAFT_644294 [Wilcoxina mikolae CBS 423.85]|nr:hypothetical protein K440DRAFT_644294 [Wilcoxina mikolae CBS 423.85]
MFYTSLDRSASDRPHVTVPQVSEAHGMFQWVNLQIKFLSERKLEETIEKNLGKLPRTLEATYSEIFKAIDDAEYNDRETARIALMWIICSSHPLSPEEWCSVTGKAAAVKAGVNTLFNLCQNLATLDEQSNVVRFAHLSVREYLEKHKFST